LVYKESAQAIPGPEKMAMKMAMKMRRLGLLWAGIVAAAVPALASGTSDRLEPGKQGETIDGEARVLPQPYSKGVRVVGHNAIGKRNGNLIMTGAGLRIADLRDPANPVEVAYFKPGDFCGSHVRYVPKTSQIWFACKQSGFHVIELNPELRRVLRLQRAKG
jgi:hypothetical protein